METSKERLLVTLDLTLTPDLLLEGNARELARGIQDLRKKMGLTQEDEIECYYFDSVDIYDWFKVADDWGDYKGKRRMVGFWRKVIENYGHYLKEKTNCAGFLEVSELALEVASSSSVGGKDERYPLIKFEIRVLTKGA